MTTIFHTDTLVQLHNKLYKNLLTKNDITSNELSKKLNEEEEVYGYILEKENKETGLKDRYFLPTNQVQNLPLMVVGFKKFSYKTEVLKLITDAVSRKIPVRKDMTFREMIDYYANYSHTNPKHWLLARLIMITSYCERLNIRIVSEASFGKDALADILNITNGGVSNLYNATLAKLKYSLNNDLIIINELGGLKKEEIGSLQTYLTQAGAHKPVYENNSRSCAGTKETINLENKSHIIYHNTPEYYRLKGQQYFEEMFTPAIMDRFPGLLMMGFVSEDFSKPKSADELSEREVGTMKKFIASLNYYKQNNPNTQKYIVQDDFWEFEGKEKQRSLRSFKTIMKYLSEYSQSGAEFEELCELLKKCWTDYKCLSGYVRESRVRET